MKKLIIVIAVLSMAITTSCSSGKTTTQRGFINADDYPSVYISRELLDDTSVTYYGNAFNNRNHTVIKPQIDSEKVVRIQTNNNVDMYHVEANQTANAVGVQALVTIGGMILTNQVLGTRYHNYNNYYYGYGGYGYYPRPYTVKATGYHQAYNKTKNDVHRGYIMGSIQSGCYPVWRP